MEKISVIIPIYNAEKMLKESVESVLHQSYKNLEIILVDDGSKDSSGIICDEYKKIDTRIKVIHKQNGGLSSARNAGMDIATGKYLMFIDADDIFEPNSCEVLFKEIESKNADLVVGNYIHMTYEGEKWENPLFDPTIYDNFKLSITDYQKSFFVMNSVVWNKIFNREFIEKLKLRFIPKAIAEDAIFSSYCYVHTDNAYYISDVVYNYRQNPKNISISTNCSKQYFEGLNSSYKKIYENFETTNNLGFYRFFYARIMPYLLCKIIDTNSLKDDSEIIDVLKMLSWFFIQKERYNVVVLDERLNNIVKKINENKYIDALNKIKETRKYRDNLDEVEKEKMYAPNKELYKKMS